MTTFAELELHPTLAEAIAAKGYSTPTPVQLAVLDARPPGADLLVSSRTGSGKTLAFGLLIGQQLLAAAAPPLPGARGGAPGKRPRAPARALVIAPTRELATQVAGELRWLLAPGRLRVAAFTGGTPIGRDLHALAAAPDLVVGTPGRLVDLHRRGALDLGGLAVVVLDEADEMLDMGFQEDLEYLLAQAPASRRTLLFSATLPPPIVKLARGYQRDPVRVDARHDHEGGGAGGAHADIRFVGHLVRPEDRLGAVVNLLLCGPPGDKAIVFCRTRERVGELHQHLVRLGLRASAIAGDRTQGERDRALRALREGDVQVLVATDVAARGLDLPDVARVIHADLPDGPDAFTHRSGRTGRAGKKGTAILIAEPRERRKAERLLQATGATCTWSAPPDAEAVERHGAERLAAELLAAERQAPAPAAAALLEHLRAQRTDAELLALLVAREQARLPAGLSIAPLPAPGREPGPAGAPRRGAHAAEARAGDGGDRREPSDTVVFQINLGHGQRAEARWLLPTLCRRGQVTRAEIGAIRIGKQATVFEVAAEAAESFARAAARPDPRAPEVRIVSLGPGRADGFARRDLAPARAPFQTRRPAAARAVSGRPPGSGAGAPGRPSRAHRPARPVR